MQSIRRLYLYVVAFVSLETVLWGAIGLVRSIFAGATVGDNRSLLAGALSLILVGVPVFLVHWWLAQRGALKDIEERSARIRAVFLYGASMATFVPVVQNILALLSRTLITAFGGVPGGAMFGGEQTLLDNLIAILMNGVIGVYIYTVIAADWRMPVRGEAYPEVRRLYRYLWMLYSLAMVVFGVQQVVQYALGIWGAVGSGGLVVLANGLALLLAGVPVWVWVWRLIQRSLVQPSEAGSAMRLTILYLLTFVSVISVLSSAGVVLFWVLRVVLGEAIVIDGFLARISAPFSVALPFGVVWAYFGRTLAAETRSLPDISRRAGLQRLYNYVLSLIGLGATFLGIYLLLAFVLDLWLGQETIWGNVMRENLAASLATLLVGLPLWVFTWRPMVVEAAREGEAGDHARRSVIRKAYLYLALFAGVMGVMFGTGALLYQYLRTWLGGPVENLALNATQQLKTIGLFALLLVYHWRALRSDNRLAESSLTKLHAQFPVLVLAPDEGDFRDQLVATLEREVVDLPVAVHPYSQGAPGETLSAAKLVILPSDLLAKTPEAIRLWLQTFTGARLVVPISSPGWHWVFGGERPADVLARQTARIVRHLAEGEEIPRPRESSPWQTVVYVLAGLFGLEILLLLVSFFASLIFD